MWIWESFKHVYSQLNRPPRLILTIRFYINVIILWLQRNHMHLRVLVRVVTQLRGFDLQSGYMGSGNFIILKFVWWGGGGDRQELKFWEGQ